MRSASETPVFVRYGGRAFRLLQRTENLLRIESFVRAGLIQPRLATAAVIDVEPLEDAGARWAIGDELADGGGQINGRHL